MYIICIKSTGWPMSKRIDDYQIALEAKEYLETAGIELEIVTQEEV